MPIPFKLLLAQAGIEPEQVRMLRHKVEKADLFAIWRNDRPAFEAFQSAQSRTSRSYFTRPWWASFLRMSDGRTLFVGMYRATLIGDMPDDYVETLATSPGHPSTMHVYNCQLAEELGEYIGRVFITWSGVNWRQNGEGDHMITQINDTIRDPGFPGLLEFFKPLSEIARLPESWRPHLAQSKGVYLLTCPETREQYVGKADGEGGFLARWVNYAANGHGGNIRLRSRAASDYQVTILQVAGSSDGPREIGRMEERWKRKLQSREMGLNGN